MKRILLVLIVLSFSLVNMNAQNVIKDVVNEEGERLVEYTPQGVCSKLIEIQVKGDTILDVKYTRGCEGNLKAIGILVKGAKIDEVIGKLEGNECGNRGTSCTDQLAKALIYIKNNEPK